MVQRYVFVVIFCLIFSEVCAQHQEKVDFLHAEVNVRPNALEKTIDGRVDYKFKVLEHVDSVFLDAENIDFNAVLLNHRKVRYKISDTTVTIHKKLKKNRNYDLTLEYSAKPKQTVYFLGWDDDVDGRKRTLPADGQIWTQGQGKYSSHWLPSFDDMEEKVEFDLHITFDASYTIISNGKLRKTKVSKGLKTWSFDMQNPMSSYLLGFAIGDYDKQELTASSGIPIENYFYPQDSLRVEPTYRYTKEIFDFMEAEIGVPYPWEDYKQIPVKDFLYSGMENTGATIFSDAFVIDSTAFLDRNYVNVNAHELAHQWFGNLVTEKDGHHHWLHEGFATYYAYLAQQKIFGDDFFYWKLYDSAQQLNEFSKEGKGEALTNPKASSLTFYEKGAWALVMLRNEIGDTAFKQGIKNYLNKHRYQNVTIDDFMDEMELVGSKDLSTFKRSWLGSSVFPMEKVTEYLIGHSTSVAAFVKLQWELTTSLENNESIVQKYWEASDNEEFKARLVLKYHKLFSHRLLKEAFESKSIKIRQGLALTSSKIPLELKTNYESLLDDESYITQENALYRLWISFPQDRALYLNKTKGSIGLPDKNVRLLWLLLAGLTKDYDLDRKEGYLSELLDYTSPTYSMGVRQNAFGIINEVLGFTDQNLLDLIEASRHHSWQFRKFSRNLLDSLLTVDEQRNRIIELTKGLNEEEVRYLNTKLNLE
ncbi:M1 family metallopeptidase [Maribacter polysaccharolyticus]|uniref:M1 family metallopeptidase n=1 Tax=Maribacter polysaccharolyticus TaxID=3020831 RepID=UPI00237F251E|nr:M1 family metallopeptidase [Maribacter polysaccharolyticus]MDE3740595.1 M1 family metallopeptidase [Maribacter polysaccharolyticus]